MRMLTFDKAVSCDTMRLARSISSSMIQGLTLRPPSTPGFLNSPIATSVAPLGPLFDLGGLTRILEGPKVVGVCPRRHNGLSGG